MRPVLIALILAIACATCANGFIFKKKFVDGCNPDPCKHDGVCKIDKNDKKKFECVCPANKYHGPVCEHKSGCRKNPCGKHGTCSNDHDDQKNYHCKCEPTYVGKDCDIKDKCLTKNPCKAGSVCSLDKKFKPVCTCKNGFSGSKCDKRHCTITQFKGRHFESKQKIFVDEEIEKKYTKLDSLAKLCGVTVMVTQSFTKLVNPNDMVKNNLAPFFTGRGLRFEIMDNKGKKVICDTKCLGKTPIGDKKAACFINGLDAIQWKYSTYLPGILHDGQHVLNFGDYNKLKELKQVGCQQDKKFPVVKGRDHLVVDYKPNAGKQCPKGLAGPDCKKDDLCIKKNPCAKGSECTLDDKLRPVCGCPIGYKGKKCNSKNCTITAWKGKRFGGHWYGRTKVYISEDLEKSFKKLDDLAKICKVNFDLKGSFKKNNNLNYKIDEKSPFYIGYGIDVELLDDKKKLLCNKVCLGKSSVSLPGAKCLLDGLSAIGFKHNPRYPGIIYEGSMLTHTALSYAKLKELKQVGCSGERWFRKL